jgi:hypothetical protein
MPQLPDVRSLFDDISLPTVKRVIAKTPVRVLCLPGEILIFARNYQELIRVEPRFRKGGGLEMGYSLRDPQVAAYWLDLLRKPVKEQKKYDYRAGQPRRLGRAGRIA